MLPDSQMDRFMVRLSLGYPSAADEAAMVISRRGGNPLQTMEALLSGDDLIALQQMVENTYVGDVVTQYAVALIHATRNHPQIRQGASPRATLSVIALAKAVAQLRGRDYVLPEDISGVFIHVVSHRLQLSDEASLRGISPEKVLQKILHSVKAPALR